MWWLKAVGTPDVAGRTPLHYASVIGNAGILLCLLSARCRGRFSVKDCRAASGKKGSGSHVHRQKNRVNHANISSGSFLTERDLLDPSSYYETLTGEDIGQSNSVGGMLS